MSNNIVRIIKNTVIVIILFILSNILTAVVTLFLARISSNVQIMDFKVVFDPLITIAYLMIYYFLQIIYQPRQDSINKLFLLTLFLSFSMDFFKGAVFINILFYLLRKTNLI